ncbi:MAG: DUF1569 domain-containing protein [Chloroherpetonaceae bacterium]|nr:DUF1569 domain-containing protein [Chloroherpetonaceae bacterium]
MLDIHNSAQLSHLLNQLQPKESPVFGAFSAQGMIEHLYLSLQISNGNLPQTLHFPERKAEIIKQRLIHSPNEIPVGFKSPIVPDLPPPLIFESIEMAKTNLLTALSNFHQFFLENPDAKPMNPTMGELNKTEWETFHTKHFTHHFKQFKLI